MAVFEYFENMYDTRLKPRLLKSLIKDRLPDEKHPFPSPLELSALVSSIKTHGLLSESFREPVDRKLVENWNSAVDAWVERLLSLVSCKMPDKCWAGICLLGVTCQECSSSLFLASYSAWFQKLLSQIQHPSSNSHFVKVACCASLSDLFTRLAGFLNLKKDGTAHAGKVIQPILKLLTEDDSVTVWEGSVDLLCTLITLFPASVHRHYDNVEAVIVTKIMWGKCNGTISQKFAQCLALLPKVKGDEDSWSLMMQKVLLAVNTHLNVAFQGLEEESKGTESMRLLVPPGKDLPTPLGGQAVTGNLSDQASKGFQPLQVSSMSTLIGCCCMLLTNPYPVQVTVPVRPLLSLVWRVLLVDGSLFQSLMPFASVKQQEFICTELPVLHLCSLDLLISIIKGVRSQLLPHAAEIVRLLTKYFRSCLLPSLRIKVYSLMRILLISMGAGMALYLTQEVITNAFADLQFVNHGSRMVSSSLGISEVPSEALQQHSQRKRKHASGSPAGAPSKIVLDMEELKHKQIPPVCLQIAALQALEALVTVGGALRSESWRADVDCLLITVATNASEGAWSNEEKNSFLFEEKNLTQADFQLAAFRALLASLLSPARVRPPYLSQGLELFRRGKQETGTKLAEFCSHALLALEVLIHPRALPVSDFSSASQSTFGEGLNQRFSEGSQKPNISFSRGILGSDDFDPDDDLCDSWLGNGEQMETQNSHPPPDKMMGDASKPSDKDTMPVIQVNKVSYVSSITPVRDENMVDQVQAEVPVSSDGLHVVPEQVLGSFTTSAGYDGGGTETGGIALSGGDEGSDIRKEASLSGSVLPIYTKGKGLRYSPDSEASSLDSLPDIVDADPDSSDADSG